MTAFIGLMIVEPFLNRFVHNLNVDSYKELLIVGLLLFVIPPINTWYNDLLWFIYLYLVAAYMRLYEIRWLVYCIIDK